MRQKTIITNLLQSMPEVYYKGLQVLQSVTDCNYKVRRVIQSVTVITKWDVTEYQKTWRYGTAGSILI